jgi:hypothetical protein
VQTRTSILDAIQVLMWLDKPKGASSGAPKQKSAAVDEWLSRNPFKVESAGSSPVGSPRRLIIWIMIQLIEFVIRAITLFTTLIRRPKIIASVVEP